MLNNDRKPCKTPTGCSFNRKRRARESDDIFLAYWKALQSEEKCSVTNGKRSTYLFRYSFSSGTRYDFEREYFLFIVLLYRSVSREKIERGVKS